METPDHTHDVAIIGGGFSGLMVLHHLVINGETGSSYILFEPGEPGQGIAYGTPNPAHLLNVPAESVGAFPDRIDDFLQWLGTEEGQREAVALGVRTEWHAGDFAPRVLYARYLAQIYKRTLTTARERNITVVHQRQRIERLEPKQDGIFSLTDDTGAPYHARNVVLALGNQSKQMDETVPVVRDVWRFDYKTLKNAPGPVAILGTGLSMVDTFLSLRQGGYEGKVIAVSRNALLPSLHHTNAQRTPGNALPSPADLTGRPGKLPGFMRRFRRDIETVSSPATWQAVFSLWRPYLPDLWRALPIRDRMRFFRRLFTLWNVHRHCMAPESWAELSANIQNGGLEILKSGARLWHKDGMKGITAEGTDYPAQEIFDTRGVCYDLPGALNPLIAQLLKDGLITPHETGWGLACTQEHRVSGAQWTSPPYVIGSLTIGEYLETTAVPELRGQAREIARGILS